MTDPRSGRPIYGQVADDLRERITTGDLKPGSVLPAEVDLAAHYDVGRDTLRDALDILVAEGWIEKRRGHRSLVRHTPLMARVQVDMAGREIGGRPAREADATQWGVPVGAPMLTLIEVTVGADGVEHEVELEAWPADRTRLRHATPE